jgi:hypothetical protein
MKRANDEKKSRHLTKSVLRCFVTGGYHKAIISTQVKEFGDGFKPSCVIFQRSDQAFRPLVVSEEDAPFLIHGIKETASIKNAEAVGQIHIDLRDEHLDFTINLVIEVRVVNNKQVEKLILSLKL